MPYLSIFGVEFQKAVVIYKINTLKFAKFQNFAEKESCIRLGA